MVVCKFSIGGDGRLRLRLRLALGFFMKIPGSFYLAERPISHTVNTVKLPRPKKVPLNHGMSGMPISGVFFGRSLFSENFSRAWFFFMKIPEIILAV